MNRLFPPRSLALPALLAALSATAFPARADTSQVSAGGFISAYREEVSVPPDVVWKAVLQLPKWWNGRHTYSGSAANLTLDAQAGGCWCERWGSGDAAASVQHGTVLMVMPGRVLRVQGGFGPLQELGAIGILTIVTATQEGKHLLRMTYRVSGHPDAGFDKLAGPVDGVIGEQFRRLKKLAETGSAE
ncbi:MAG: SRPBCC domain-containing protein [Rubrivivax sp.]|nr:SRPBCC domain-containing protein [Rubrivivax sp.]